MTRAIDRARALWGYAAAHSNPQPEPTPATSRLRDCVPANGLAPDAVTHNEAQDLNDMVAQTINPQVMSFWVNSTGGFYQVPLAPNWNNVRFSPREDARKFFEQMDKERADEPLWSVAQRLQCPPEHQPEGGGLPPIVS